MRILDIQRMSTEDGAGLRTTVFLKGCPLACKWCHNPESIDCRPHVEWYGVRCIGCLSCVKACPNGALAAKNGIEICRDKCKRCFACAEACPAEALEIKGADKEVSALFEELIRDRAYWGEDGGITLSGGEALIQSEEAAELLKMLKACGVHTAVDTCGFCKRSDIDMVLPYTDLFLYDIKIMDGGGHKAWTGQDNAVIKENFDYLCDQVKNTGAKIWVRTPVIPGATDSLENITAIARFIDNRVERWELCAFNNLCRDKYERLHLKWEFAKEGSITKQKLDGLVEAAAAAGAIHVTWTGNAQQEGL